MANKPRPKAPRPKSAPTPKGPSRNVLILLAIAAIAAVALIAGSIALTGGDDGAETAPVTGETVLTGIPQTGTVLGDAAANVTLIEYADLQCPFCKEFADTGFPEIVEEYVKPGKIKMEFRGLAFLGADSEKALRFVQSAGLQDKLWNMTEALYANQGEENSGWVTDELVREVGESIPGLDVDKMFAETDAPEVDAAIAEASEQATAAEVQGTPAFFIQIGDAAPYAIQVTALTIDGFRAALDDALAP